MGKRVDEVRADLKVEEDAANAIALQLINPLPPEQEEELKGKLKYHMNRMLFFSFALDAAKREDENEELIELGRKAKEAGFHG